MTLSLLTSCLEGPEWRDDNLKNYRHDFIVMGCWCTRSNHLSSDVKIKVELSTFSFRDEVHTIVHIILPHRLVYHARAIVFAEFTAVLKSHLTIALKHWESGKLRSACWSEYLQSVHGYREMDMLLLPSDQRYHALCVHQPGSIDAFTLFTSLAWCTRSFPDVHKLLTDTPHLHLRKLDSFSPAPCGLLWVHPKTCWDWVTHQLWNNSVVRFHNVYIVKTGAQQLSCRWQVRISHAIFMSVSSRDQHVLFVELLQRRLPERATNFQLITSAVP